MVKRPLLIGVIAAVILVVGLGWAYFESTKPLPGKEDLWDDRTHKPQTEVLEYKSNPPTSGPHYAEPEKPGVYSTPPLDGKLVHSMEHGYVIIWYNCDKKVTSTKVMSKAPVSTVSDKLASLIGFVYAHGSEEEHATESADIATNSANLSENFRSNECQELVSNLTKIYDEKNKFKIIVTPRSSLDSRIALTVWGRVDKFDQFDKNRILTFIDKLRDHGPEKTME